MRDDNKELQQALSHSLITRMIGIGVPVMVHLGGGKTKFARILRSRTWGRGRAP